MTDKTLHCSDCGHDFVWTAREQEFFQQKGFTNEPKRCKDCRTKKHQQHRDHGHTHPHQRRA